MPDSPLHCAVGQVGEFHAVVTEADTAEALGSGDLAVLGTPRILAWLERASCLAVAGTVDSDWTTVGAHVNLDHLAPSRVGEAVTCRAELTEVKGRRLTFAVSAHSDSNSVMIARGTVLRVAIQRSSVD